MMTEAKLKALDLLFSSDLDEYADEKSLVFELVYKIIELFPQDNFIVERLERSVGVYASNQKKSYDESGRELAWGPYHYAELYGDNKLERSAL